MFAFEIRLDFSDGYEIVTVEASSIDEAVQTAKEMGADETTLLARVDLAPQVALIFG